MIDWKPEIRARLAGLKLEPTREAAIIEELAQHLDDCYAELLAGGTSEAEAYRQAIGELSGSELLPRELRRLDWRTNREPIVLGSNRRVNMIADLWQDLRYGARMLVKQPGFSLIAILTLALGIGANTAIFTVVDAALLRGLPYQDAGRLVQVWETRRLGEIKQLDASYPDYLDWGQQTAVIEGICGYTGWDGSFTLTGRTEAERIEGARVTASFFSVLGVTPLLGRGFLPDEDKTSAAATVIINHELWQRRFGADPQIVGRQIVLDGNGYTVLGVLPPSFQFAPMPKAELWVPLRPTPNQLNRRFMHWLDVIARLRPGISLEQASAQMNTVSARIERENADSHTGVGLKLVPLQEQIIGSVGSLLFILLVAVGCVLLIACANVANLQLLRASARRQEISIRLALGATRWRLVRQLFAESLLLTLLGGALGMTLAIWGVELLLAAIPSAQLAAMPYLQGITLNGRVFVFTSGLSLLTGVVFGLVPAWQSVKLDVNSSLKDSGRASTGSGRQRFRSLLVVTEIALALVLLVAAGLLIKSTKRLLEVKLGFNPERLLTLQMELPTTKYSTDAQVRDFHQQLLSRVETLPGVISAASVNWLPLEGGPVDLLRVEGQPAPSSSAVPKTTTHVVSSAYFQTMGVALLKGRYFTDNDHQSAPQVLIINNTLARKLFGQQDPLGHRLFFEGDDPKPFEIVGVVDDERIGELDGESVSVVYRPYLQDPWTKLNLVVRTSGEPEGVVNAVRGEVRALDQNLALYAVASMEQLIAEHPATFLRRYPALLLGIFAALALILAVIGIYGVISNMVSQRTHELGIRMALGAGRSEVLKLIIGQGLRLTLLGVASGLVGAVALTRLMRSLLFEVSATDPLIFGFVTVLLVAAALLACYLPARRAAKLDPLAALRSTEC
jgi:putative ABC transport system permease protein